MKIPSFYGSNEWNGKRNFTNSTRNGRKKAEMRNNSAKSGMVGMSGSVCSGYRAALYIVGREQLCMQHLPIFSPTLWLTLNKRESVISCVVG